MSSAGSRKIPHNDAASQNDDNYQYFLELYNQFGVAGQNNVQDDGCSKLGSRCELPPIRKKRKLVDGEHRDDGTPNNNNEEDDGPIENMDFVRDHKATLDETKIPNITDSHHSKVGDCIESKHDYHHAHQPPGGQESESLYRHLSIPDIDNLLGWATRHCKSSHNSSTKASPADDALYDQERRLGLSHIPTAPPPPSHIQYLHECISERVMTNTANTLHDEATAAGGDDGNKKNKTAMHNDNIDTSAYVAVGMAVEEVLTMALMPLAEAHIERCRRLERQKNCDATATEPCARKIPTMDPFHSWTLPPAEAMVQLARDGVAKNQNGPLVSLLDRYSKSANMSAKLD